ncbi:hypothetical protein SCUCBS95973_000561 [Sporothrix curviconia]|uniref:J domain-containing protein n=1 Tax=Sporothrix curviconia TaxID=1260050 RepID=A0ABP0ARC9_9PEZI
MVVETALYERLGVTHDASGDQIRRSYRQAALLWHPDRNRDNPEAAEKFKACLEAYEILSNPDRRLLYDTYGLSGIQRTPEAPTQPTQQPTQAQPSSDYRRARRQQRRPAPPSFFDDDDDNFFFSFPTHAHTQTQTQRSSGGGGGQPQFSFSSSFTFSTSTSSGGGGSYTTHYQSWNSRDGHQSRRSSGTFGPGGSHTISNSSNSGNTGSRSSRHSHDDQQQQQQQQSTMRSDSSRSSGRPATREEDVHPAQNMQSMFNLFQPGGGLFGPSDHIGGGFGGIFTNMASDFSTMFANHLFGEPEYTQNRSSSGRQQQYRQYRER